MNASPHFRYYAAFVLIVMLALLLRVQTQPAGANEQAGPEGSTASYDAASAKGS